MSLRGAEREPKVRHGIFNVELYLSGGSFVRKFIIPSGLIPNSYKPKLFSAGAKREPKVRWGIKPDFRIKQQKREVLSPLRGAVRLNSPLTRSKERLFMPRSRDYIPANDAEFNDWFKFMTQYIAPKLSGASPAWDHIPPRHFQELITAYTDWYNAYALTLQPHTPAVVTAKNDARRKAERVIRPFVRRFLYFEPVTNADRVNMRLPLHDKIRTDHIAVPEEVEYNLIIEGIRVVHVDFKVLGSDHKAKPEGYDGAVIVWDVLDAPPADPDILNRHTMASRTPFILEFPEEERGKTVYTALCWQNERGLTGRWSDIKSTVIP